MRRFFCGIFFFFLFAFCCVSVRAVYPTPHSPAPYRTDQIIVRYKNASYLPEFRSFAYQSAISALETKTGVVEDAPLFPPPPNTAHLSGDDPFWATFRLIKTNGSVPIETVLNEYRKDEGVQSATFDRYLTIQVDPNDPNYSQLWGMKKIQAPQAWDTTTGSTSVTVAVLDTGADYTHPDLKDALLPGVNFVTQGATAQDDHGHGTHVSGTIGAIGNNGVGVAGINWTVKILPVKVLNSQGSGSLSQIANGMKYVADNADANHVKAINMSLGGRGTSLDCQSTFDPIIAQLKQKGVVVVAAAGNDAANTASYVPASCNDVLTVGATDSSDNRASFSNYGTQIELSAPGTTIYSTCRGGGYCQMSGTSMASPHVAGTVGLMFAANPNLTVDQVTSILSSAANLDPLTTSGSMPIGAGRLNLAKAIAAAQNGAPPQTSPTTQPSSSPTTSVTVSPTSIPSTQPSQQPSTTDSPTSSPIPTSTTVPSPTPTSLPIPDPPSYVCTPVTITPVPLDSACTCSSGSCSSSCKFNTAVTPTITKAPLPSLFPSRTTTPGTFPRTASCENMKGTCDTSANCSAQSGYSLPYGCDAGQVCCFNSTVSPTSARQIDDSTVSIASTISCKNDLGQDVPEFCNRPMRTVGDVDGNDIVNELDYLLAVRAKAKAPVPNTVNADVDGNGVVDDKDLAIIRQTLRSLCR